mgnify:CR=1 FL=1
MAIIDDPSAYFQTVIYTGNATARSITFDGNSDMQPDWIWGKQRSGTDSHQLTDVVRGVTKILNSDTTAAENTTSAAITAFNSDGFSLGTGGGYNGNNVTQVAWNWKAGTTSGITTTNSTITPAGYSFNQTSGFSVIKYPGNATIARCPHGLGVAPAMIIIKDLASNNWQIYHVSLGNTKVIYLNTTGAAETTSARWNNTSPDAVNWTMGTTDAVNGNGHNYVAYCFAEKQGYSKFGSYIGNGNADGVFVYLGFKPAFVMTKRTDGTGGWFMQDNKRLGYNYANYRLFADDSGAESTASRIDLLSNGFKCRDNDGNGSGYNYIYMAFAENPFVAGNFNVATAR